MVLKVLNPCLSIASLALKMKEDELAQFWMEKGNTSGKFTETCVAIEKPDQCMQDSSDWLDTNLMASRVPRYYMPSTLTTMASLSCGAAGPMGWKPS